MSEIGKRVVIAACFALAIIFIGTFGYWFIFDMNVSLLDCLLMTMITISTVGYTYVVDISSSAAGKWFTIFLILSGIGIIAYFGTTTTALIIERNWTNWRRKMLKKAGIFDRHIIVCSSGFTKKYIIDEILLTGNCVVSIEPTEKDAREFSESTSSPNIAFLVGDPGSEQVLTEAGIGRASGLIAAMPSDKDNIIITVTVRNMRKDMRIIAAASDISMERKLRGVGADAIVFPERTGGMRMVSEMLRPEVVSFLDQMLRDREKVFRVEEITVSTDSACGISSVKSLEDLLVLAVKPAGQEKYVYNPGRNYMLKKGDVIILLATPEQRATAHQELECR